MEKVVNGQLVDVGDIRLFELALEGIALNQRAVNKVNIELKYDDNVGKCIDIYNKAYSKLPFPLYSIETNLKYSCLAKIIEKELDKKLSNNYNLWVDKSLHIFIKDSLIDLKFIGSTWSIDYIEEPYKDNTDIDLYKQDVGYDEYKWIVENHSESSNLAIDFYSKFMSNLLRACGSDASIMIREFTNILNFENVPNPYFIKPNTVVDTNKSYEYFLDVYCKEIRETGRNSFTIDLTVEDSELCTEKEVVPIIGIKAFKKSLMSCIDNVNILGGIEEDNIISKILDDTIEMDLDTDIRGIKVDNKIILEIDNEIYKLDLISKTLKLIGNGISFYSFLGNYVYFIRKQKVRNGVIKNIIYKYSTLNGSITVSKIFFS